MDKIKIFMTSFFQIGLVAINTILIQKGIVFGMFLISFTISFLWCYNVSKISISDFKSKIIYSLGAGFGAIENNRRYLGVELKENYFDLAVKNLTNVEMKKQQLSLL